VPSARREGDCYNDIEEQSDDIEEQSDDIEERSDDIEEQSDDIEEQSNEENCSSIAVGALVDRVSSMRPQPVRPPGNGRWAAGR
jgi:uncharacterized protein (UPF0305 family)